MLRCFYADICCFYAAGQARPKKCCFAVVMTGGEGAVVRLQAFVQAPSEHAAARNKLVAVVVARMEPQKCGDLGARETKMLVALPNCFPIREDAGTRGHTRRTARVDHS